jgi:hypothetical protein
MEMKTPDKVASSYSKNPPKLKVTTFSGSDEGSHVLLEGNHRALRMLGEMLIAMADRRRVLTFTCTHEEPVSPSSTMLRRTESTSVSWTRRKLVRMHDEQ